MSRTLTVFPRYIYDDVALLASTDADAPSWRLEVESPNRTGWNLVHPAIQCSSLNWRTNDMRRWADLRDGDPAKIREIFPRVSGVVPFGLPLAVTWDVSNQYYDTNPQTGGDYVLRFTDPDGRILEFKCRDVMRTGTHLRDS